MVSKRRLDRGLIGFRAPDIPKAPRSARKRGPHKKYVEEKNLCAFELLASVAGRLLEESISSASSNVAEEKSKLCIDQNGIETMEVSVESTFVPEISGDFKGVTQGEIGSDMECRSINASSDTLESVDRDVKLIVSEIKDDAQVQSEEDKNQIGDVCMANTSTVKEPNEDYVNNNNNNHTYNNLLNNSESSVQLPLYRDQISNALSLKRWKNVQLGIRDDDDNSFDKFSTRIRPFRSQARFGHRKIKKTSSSLRHRKAAPKTRERGFYSTNEGMKSFYRYRNNIYAGDRYQYVPIKKRKLYYHNSAHDQMDRANVAFRPMKIHKKATDSQVKLKIKSFIVPELYVDVSETDTVGYLKRAVMGEIAALLGGGIRVGVVLKGKKVRDDHRTLKQAGISESSNLENLGFALEPLLTTRVCPPKKINPMSPCEVYNESLRSPGTPVVDSVISNVSIDPNLVKNIDDMNNEKPESSSQTLSNKGITDVADPDCKAIVPVLAINAEALTMVPLNPKQPKRSELSQRRTRRPFSVTEVEALVSGVERLGTGRWRDVKMGAFENADHRTYVDLKDKWKTLVHTASISPQQRRGEPVPQELLDRVLTAHSYWSQHQSKQHGKINLDSMVKMETFS